MDFINNIVLRCLFCNLFLWFGLCARTSDLIYYDVATNSSGMCFRRFNATHQIGCSSGRSGNVGVVYYAEDNSTIEKLITNGTDAPYIVLLSPELFQISGRFLISNKNKVNGVVLMPINETAEELQNYSEDKQCPNDRYGLYGNDSKYGKCSSLKWNPQGSGLMFEDFPFPVFSLANFTIADFVLKECFLKHNAPGPDGRPLGDLRCGMLIKDIMDGAKDTPTCVRRSKMVMNLSPQRYCDALGAENIFATIRPIYRHDNNSVIIVAARYDSFSMFDGQYPGINSAALSYVTVFAIAEALGRVRSRLMNATTKHVMLALFHGEAFDYIGSSRMVYDMQKNQTNFTLDDIDMFVEIGQIGLHPSLTPHPDTVWIHTGINEMEQASKFKAILKNVSAEVNLSLLEVTEKQPLPPASLQSFLKARKDIPGIVLTNHEQGFTNRFYNSMYDTVARSGLVYPPGLNNSEKYDYIGELAAHLQKVSTVVARAVYQLAVDSKAEESQGLDLDDCSSTNATVANLLYCLTVNPDCELLNSSYSSWMVPVLQDPTKFLSRYVGVSDFNSNIDSFNLNLFARFLGDVIDNANESICKELHKNDSVGYSYIYMQGPINDSSPTMARIPLCMKAVLNKSAALSPAFIINDYDWSRNEYSSWTESSWAGGDTISAKIFLIPRHKQEVMTFSIGVVLLIISFVLVYAIERRSSVLFTPSQQPLPSL